MMKDRPDYIIEIDEEAVGLAMAEEDGVRFHAVHPAVQQLHGRTYPDTTDARRAVVNAFRCAA